MDVLLAEEPMTPAPDIKVRKMPERPGFLRVKNTAPFTISFLYGSRREEEPDGTLRMAAKEAGSYASTALRSSGSPCRGGVG
jgi:hypothetical protein